MFAIHLEGSRQYFQLIFRREHLHRPKRHLKPWLVELAAGIILELWSKRRHHMECRMHSREFLQHANHSPVILERMQARPREHIATRLRLTVERLVHMPKHNQKDAGYFRQG